MLWANAAVLALNTIADAAASIFRVMVQSPVLPLTENQLDTVWFNRDVLRPKAQCASAPR
jgi:hypothetical protein